jgi:DNA-binding NarL/FixJ family response regulator
MTNFDAANRGSLIRVLVANDHRLIAVIRACSRDWDDVEICSEVCDGPEAVTKCQELRPDLAVLASDMGTISGFEAARQIQRLSPNTAIMVVSPGTAN